MPVLVTMYYPHLLVFCDTLLITLLGTCPMQIIHIHCKNFKKWYVSKIQNDFYLCPKGTYSFLCEFIISLKIYI